MHTAIAAYNAAQPNDYPALCTYLAEIIDACLPTAESKVWHRAPVWFLDGNPVVGYATRKAGVTLLFWSGQSFNEPNLEPEGSFKAAQNVYQSIDQIDKKELLRWLKKAQLIQWDYKNIVKRKGTLERIG